MFSWRRQSRWLIPRLCVILIWEPTKRVCFFDHNDCFCVCLLLWQHHYHLPKIGDTLHSLPGCEAIALNSRPIRIHEISCLINQAEVHVYILLRWNVGVGLLEVVGRAVLLLVVGCWYETSWMVLVLDVWFWQRFYHIIIIQQEPGLKSIICGNSSELWEFCSTRSRDGIPHNMDIESACRRSLLTYYASFVVTRQFGKDLPILVIQECPYRHRWLGGCDRYGNW